MSNRPANRNWSKLRMNLPSAALTQNGSAERYQRAKTPHTIFTWWARRPFTAMRAVLSSALAANRDLPSSKERGNARQGDIFRDLEATTLASVKVLDPFSGGGTIPLEVASMGAGAYALENNELAQFTEFALLELSATERLP